MKQKQGIIAILLVAIVLSITMSLPATRIQAQTFSVEQENQIQAIIQQITDLQIKLLLARIAELQAQIAELIAKQTVVEQKVDTMVVNTTVAPAPALTPMPTSTSVLTQFSIVKDGWWTTTNRCIFRGGKREYSFDPVEHMTNDGVKVSAGSLSLVPKFVSTPYKNIKLRTHLDTTSLTYESKGGGEQDAPYVAILGSSLLATKRLQLGRVDIEASLDTGYFEGARIEINEVTGVVESQLTIDSMTIDGVAVQGLPITYAPIKISLCQ